ncbi:hypothetical protein Bbelb_431620 [Branchiostoma belcheri]|nr:hypothetical protein Bbelb_431620 [Branchiostoma belcheri]
MGKLSMILLPVLVVAAAANSPTEQELSRTWSEPGNILPDWSTARLRYDGCRASQVYAVDHGEVIHDPTARPCYCGGSVCSGKPRPFQDVVRTGKNSPRLVNDTTSLRRLQDLSGKMCEEKGELRDVQLTDLNDKNYQQVENKDSNVRSPIVTTPTSERQVDRSNANGYSSAIFHHLQHNQGHSFKLESTDILDRETRWWERGVKEAIYERMYNPTLNREGGLRVDLSGTWDLALPAPRTDNT